MSQKFRHSHSQAFPFDPTAHVHVKSPCPSSVQVPASLQGLSKQARLTKQKNNKCIYNEGRRPQAYSTLINDSTSIGVRDGGQGGSCPPPKRLQSRKVGQKFNISRAKSGKLKSKKAKKPPVCWSNKAKKPKSPQFVGPFWTPKMVH